MKIAVIGAGCSGLALCYHLLKGKRGAVTLFDAKGIGGGASGMATGLLHPYVGEMGRRSWRATEAMACAKLLLKESEEALQESVACFGGIHRHTLTEEQREQFNSHEKKHGDVAHVEGDLFLIRSGITVEAPLYLEGLWLVCASMGAEMVLQKVKSLEEMAEYDLVFLTAGAGCFDFEECGHLPVKRVKGQLLRCLWPKGSAPLERSLIGKGYVARGKSGAFCTLGATYEREFANAEPCLERTLAELKPKMASFFPLPGDLQVLECKAGIRLSRKGHYLPLISKVGKKCWALTAMGSRGFLYHGYLADLLVSAVFEGESLPLELCSNGLSKNACFF